MAVTIRELSVEEARAWFEPQLDQADRYLRYGIRPGFNRTSEDTDAED